MLKKIKYKLNSNTGASFVIAMVLFLVASMVSAVTIAAANSASRSVYNTWDKEQNYLAVSSAAKTFKECLETDASDYNFFVNTSNNSFKFDYNTTGKMGFLNSLFKDKGTWISGNTSNEQFKFKIDDFPEVLMDAKVELKEHGNGKYYFEMLVSFKTSDSNSYILRLKEETVTDFDYNMTTRTKILWKGNFVHDFND